MARIGKIVTFDHSREQLSNKLIIAITKLGLTGINFSFVNDNTIHIYGEQADLTTLKTEANAMNVQFDIGADAPAEAVLDPPEPIISGTPLDSAIWRQAWNKIREEDRLAILARVNAEYDNLGGTREP